MKKAGSKAMQKQFIANTVLTTFGLVLECKEKHLKLLSMVSPFLTNEMKAQQITPGKKLLLFIKYVATETTFIN